MTKMEKIRKVLAKKTKGAVPEGDVETLNQMIHNHENKAPKQEAVGEKQSWTFGLQPKSPRLIGTRTWLPMLEGTRPC